MALESKRENNVVSALCSDVRLPRMARVRQVFDPSHLAAELLPGIVARELGRPAIADGIRPGMEIAVSCGSRGVANIAVITKAIVDFVKARGASPFVFPAMGSHGGATAEGQREILEGYGVTEAYLGCPIKASMETVEIGRTENDLPVFADRHAAQADGIILCGRIKAHTAFRGPYESGLMKMAVIGMGKQHGAETVHESGFIHMGELLPQVGKVVLERCKVIAGLGVIENAFDQTCSLHGLTAGEIITEEPCLLEMAKAKMGRLYFKDADLLVVDCLGKDISGDGMDPNVTGVFGGKDFIKRDFTPQRLVVLDLSEASHGNANGVGAADITTKRLVDKMDVDKTYPNAVTSTVLGVVKIPLFAHSDREAVQLGLRTCNGIDRQRPRVVHIRDTMHLEEIEVSEAMLEEIREDPRFEVISEPTDWVFDEKGDLQRG